MKSSSFRYYVLIAVLSCAVLLLEVTYTRIFSWKLYYYYSFFVLGLALLGISIGSAVLVRYPELGRRYFDRTLSLTLGGGALAVGLGYAAVTYTPIDTGLLLHSPTEFSKLLILILSVFLPFAFAGLGLTLLLTHRSDRIHNLYFFDLLGAGAACVGAVFLLNTLSPPGVIFLAGSLLGVTGFVWGLEAYGGSPRILGVLGLTALLLTVGLGFAGGLPVPVPDKVKFGNSGHTAYEESVYSRWNAIFRMDILEQDLPGRDRPIEEKTYKIYHEGILISHLLPYAEWSEQGSDALREDWAVALPMAAAPERPRAVVIGAAGGREMVGALAFGAREVIGVELNPAYRDVLRGRFGGFTGNFIRHPKVDYRIGEGRSYLARGESPHDLIYFVSPDSYSSRQVSSSGAFVLHESYLYTVEAIRDALDRLTDEGIVAIQLGGYFDRSPFRTPRYLRTAREAFRAEGITNVRDHVMVARSPGWLSEWGIMVLLKKTPFRASDVERVHRKMESFSETDIYAADDFDTDHPVFQPLVRSGEELRDWTASYPYNVTAVYDDSPYFWNMVGFGELILNGFRLPGQGLRGKGELVLLVLLAVGGGIGLYLAFYFFPAFLRAELPAGDKYAATLYFALIGAGFMGYEVTLIQKFTLFLGYPTYSLTICLAVLLIFTGLGSLFSGWVDRRRSTVLAALGIVVLSTAGLILGYPYLKREWIEAGLTVKVFMTVLSLAPLGLGMGAFLPTGLDWLHDRSRDASRTIAWGWAVNGFFSILASVAATMMAMSYGFTTVLLVALVLYGLAAGTLLSRPGVE